MRNHRISKRRAVFLDRDGVINEILFHREMGIIETPFTARQFKIKKGVSNAIRRINRMGYKAIVVSNQPGVGMRHFSKKTLSDITKKMISGLRKEGAFLDDIFYCLHHPTKGTGPLKKSCPCRKPKPGLFFQAARKHDIDLRNSYMVGDSILDVRAGKRAGCKTFLLAHLKCDLCHLMSKHGIKPDYTVDNLTAAVNQIGRLAKKKT